MTRHIADHSTPSQGGRVKHFLKLDRVQLPEGSHPSARALVQRPRDLGEGNRRLAEFLRIVRGREA